MFLDLKARRTLLANSKNVLGAISLAGGANAVRFEQAMLRGIAPASAASDGSEKSMPASVDARTQAAHRTARRVGAVALRSDRFVPVRRSQENARHDQDAKLGWGSGPLIARK